MPGFASLASSAAVDSLSSLFGPSWRSIASNQLRTHSFEKAPAASGAKLPTLVSLPEAVFLLSLTQLRWKDLASHGYVVIGVDHTYDAPGVVFPDGRVVAAANDFMDRLRRQSGDTESFEKNLTDRRAADLRFVVDKLPGLENESAPIFRARLDLARLGVFGHSRGGRGGVRACQLDDRIKPCLNQDGSWSWHPFWLDQSGRSLKQPFLMLDHFDPDPPVEVFRKMGATREQSSTFAYSAAPRGDGISAWPEEIRAVTPQDQILKAVNAWTQAFFDSNVRGVPGPLADLVRTPGNELEIRRYGPGSM